MSTPRRCSRPSTPSRPSRRSPGSSSAPPTGGSAARTTAARSTGSTEPGQENTRPADFTFDADHPPVLVGDDNGPTPAEHLLHALAACLTSGLANIAAARGINLEEVTSTVEGDINLLGILGLDPDVRNGYEAIRVVFHVKGDAEAEKLKALVEQSHATARPCTT